MYNWFNSQKVADFVMVAENGFIALRPRACAAAVVNTGRTVKYRHIPYIATKARGMLAVVALFLLHGGGNIPETAGGIKR